MISDNLFNIEKIQTNLQDMNKNIIKDFENFKMHNFSYKNKLRELEIQYNSLFVSLNNDIYYERIIKLNEELKILFKEFSEIILKNEKPDENKKENTVLFDIKIEMMDYTSELSEKEEVSKNIELDTKFFITFYENLIKRNDLEISKFMKNSIKRNNDSGESFNKILLNEVEVNQSNIKDIVKKNNNKKILIIISLIIIIILTIVILIFAFK